MSLLRKIGLTLALAAGAFGTYHAYKKLSTPTPPVEQTLMPFHLYHLRGRTFRGAISSDDYYAYRAKPHGADINHFADKPTPDDKYICQLRDEIIYRIADKDNPQDIAQACLDLVHRVPYVSDTDNYAKYPIETLIEGGDCEDLAILYASLAKACGLETGLVLVPGHLMAGVAVSRQWGTFVEHNHQRYYLVEGTGTSIATRPVEFGIGDVSAEYKQGQEITFVKTGTSERSELLTRYHDPTITQIIPVLRILYNEADKPVACVKTPDTATITSLEIAVKGSADAIVSDSSQDIQPHMHYPLPSGTDLENLVVDIVAKDGSRWQAQTRTKQDDPVGRQGNDYVLASQNGDMRIIEAKRLHTIDFVATEFTRVEHSDILTVIDARGRVRYCRSWSPREPGTYVLSTASRDAMVRVHVPGTDKIPAVSLECEADDKSLLLKAQDPEGALASVLLLKDGGDEFVDRFSKKFVTYNQRYRLGDAKNQEQTYQLFATDGTYFVASPPVYIERFDGKCYTFKENMQSLPPWHSGIVATAKKYSFPAGVTLAGMLAAYLAIKGLRRLKRKGFMQSRTKTARQSPPQVWNWQPPQTTEQEPPKVW
ncbi:transglutaminase domain-containing protein [Candidatus Woesearchaeota archaeon]|nr:transglutaminase domain-containing protein [Candidatus Woesearchaeota archaeon]